MTASLERISKRELHKHLNSSKKHIKFTVEEENAGYIACLDPSNANKKPPTIKTSVYSKATHTDKYLDFSSHHPSQHKLSVARILLDRAKKILSSEADKSSELKRVVKALNLRSTVT